MARSTFWMIASRVIGIIVFLLLLWIANLLTSVIDNRIYTDIVGFLNSNIWLIILIAIFSFLSEIFGLLVFPFNLPTPLFNGLASIFIVAFIIAIIKLIGKIFGTGTFNFFDNISYLIYAAVFVIVIVIGFISIFFEEHNRIRHGRKRNKKD